MVKRHKIAVIPGDGIGKEVAPAALQVLDAFAGQHGGLRLEYHDYPWGCERFLATGEMLPPDGIEQLREFDAIFLGAVGHPAVPDHVSLWGLLIPIRRRFQQYVNLRPVRLFRGVTSPRTSYNTRIGSMWWWPATSSAISSRTWGRP